MVASRSPRRTGATLNCPPEPLPRLMYQKPSPPTARAAMSRRRRVFLMGKVLVGHPRRPHAEREVYEGARQRSILADLAASQQRFQMQPDAAQQAVQPLLLGRVEATQYLLNLLAMNGKHLSNELAALVGQSDQLGPQVLQRAVADNQADSFQAIDNTRDARWTDQQPVAQVGQPQPGQPLQLGPVQRAQDAPLRTADPKAGEVRLHDLLQEPKEPDHLAEGLLRGPGRVGGDHAILDQFS